MSAVEHVRYRGPLRWDVCAACQEPWPCPSAPSVHEIGARVSRFLHEVTRAKLAQVDPEAARQYMR